MDNAGWHAQRRAQWRDSDQFRGPDGEFQRIEHVAPMAQPTVDQYFSEMSLVPPPTSLPQNGAASGINGTETSPLVAALASSTLPKMSAVERSNALKTARMNPQLMFMVGPLLRYDTVDKDGTWNGAILIVTADSGSVYEPRPMSIFKWDPDAPPYSPKRSQEGGTPFDLGPHPADPHSITALSAENNRHVLGPNAQSRQVDGQEIWVYSGNGGTFTFWRFPIQIPLCENQMEIQYNVNNGQWLEFFVPGRQQNMRWAAYSCNGFSSGVNPDDFCGPGFKTGYDPVWVDLLRHHHEEPFHALLGGGDQLYCDAVSREPELQEWLSSKPEQKLTLPLTDVVATAIDRFYFGHYCKSFRSGAFARANSTIPMMNMIDDHDLIDGFGSYPDDLQRSPIFRHIGSRGYFFFLLFQCFINPAVDGVDDEPGKHISKSLIIGSNGPYIPFPSHSFFAYLGPKTSILLLDCRAERKREQVCSWLEYQKVFQRIDTIPEQVEHLVVQLGIPIAYPRLVFLERSLKSKFNPLVRLGKAGSLGLSGFVNKFNAEAELLDDLNDHWCSDGHKKERNWFIEQLQTFAKTKRIRITFLSGDVHCAAVGVLKTLSKKNKEDILPSLDFRYMLNIVSSAIVNTPPPVAVITMVSTLATKNHRTMHYADTDETMIPLFQTDTDGSARKHKYIMGRRNWCSVGLHEPTGELVFDLRVEKEKGRGYTIGYPAHVPPPRWTLGVD